MLHVEHLHQWEVALSEVMSSYNTSVHSVTDFTPQFLMFGEEARVPIDVIVLNLKLEQKPSSYSFLGYQRLSLVSDAGRDARHVPSHVGNSITALVHMRKTFKVGDNVNILISPSKLHANCRKTIQFPKFKELLRHFQISQRKA